jgi:hypothetical protein
MIMGTAAVLMFRLLLLSWGWVLSLAAQSSLLPRLCRWNPEKLKAFSRTWHRWPCTATGSESYSVLAAADHHVCLPRGASYGQSAATVVLPICFGAPGCHKHAGLGRSAAAFVLRGAQHVLRPAANSHLLL